MTDPIAVWNRPGRYAGLLGSVSATVCSGGRL